jgi:hypothetical protein
MERHLTAPSNILTRRDRRDPEIKQMMTSSARRGTIRAPANGQPTIAPSPNHMIPCAVLGPPLNSKKAARPSMDVYMVKVDGKKAVEAWNTPGLNTMIIRKIRPMRGLRDRQIAEYNLVWHAAQKTARKNLIV